MLISCCARVLEAHYLLLLIPPETFRAHTLQTMRIITKELTSIVLHDGVERQTHTLALTLDSIPHRIASLVDYCQAWHCRGGAST